MNAALISPDLPIGQQIELALVPGNGFAALRVLGSPITPPIFGSAPIGPNSDGLVLATDWVAIDAGATTPIFTMPAPGIANQEVVSMQAYVEVRDQAGTSAIGRFTRMIEVVSSSGVVVTPNGGTSDSDLTPDLTNSLSAALAGTLARIAIGGSTLVVEVTAPGGVPIFAKTWVAISRGRIPSPLGPRPVVATASPNSGPAAGGVANSVTLTAAPGSSFLGALSVLLDGTAATIASIAPDGSTMVAVPGAFFGIPGNGPIIVTNVNGAGTDLSGGYTYTSSFVDSFAILGGNANHVHSFKMANVSHAGGVVTGWIDENTSDPSTVVLEGAPVFNASSSSWTPSQPSVSLNGINMGFAIAAADVPAGQGLFAWVVLRWTPTAVPNSVAIGYGIVDGSCFGVDNFDDNTSTVHPLLNSTRGFGGGTPPDIANAPTALWVVMQDASVGAGAVSEMAINDVVATTQTGTGSANPTNGPFRIGFNNTTGPGNFAEIEIVEWGYMPLPGSTPPSGPTLANLHAFWASAYGTP